MATDYAEATGAGVSIGRVFGRAFGVLGANPVATFGIAFLFGAVPQTLLSMFQRTLQAGVSDVADFRGRLAISLLSGLGSVLLSVLVQGGIVRATAAYAEQRTATIGECIAVGLRVLLPLLLLGILYALAVLIGSVLLLVPGIMLGIIWSVAGPALVEERLGIFRAFGRSAALTKGARWKIFGLGLLFLVLYWIVSAALVSVILSIFGMRGMIDASAHPGAGLIIFSAAVSTLLLAYSAAVQSALYIELRDWKDGPQAERLSEIFA